MATQNRALRVDGEAKAENAKQTDDRLGWSAGRQAIAEGRSFLGIELGSTRIKAALVGEDHAPLASGGHEWENRLEGGVWTYGLDDVWAGLRSAFAALAADVRERYGVPLESVGALGVSAMMHGYLAFDANGIQLAQFRTWRNTTTERAAGILTERFRFNIPQRWSAAHLYQAILDGESHVRDVAYLTTLAGYVHWKLTGMKVLGVGDASGMFPIDSAANDFDASLASSFDSLCAESGSFNWKILDILPKVLVAGENAGRLTPEGALMLDPAGRLKAGAPLCPPEGDAGTGMVSTNSVAERTGNISAGTSVFAMVVLEKPLSKVHSEIDMVTTPSGRPVAMAHCNTCTTDLDAWAKMLREFAGAFGLKIEKPALYDTLYEKALEGDSDCGGLLSYNCYSGEPAIGLDKGCPLFARAPDSQLTLANFMRALLFSAMATLKLGMDILTEQERVSVDVLFGHGGLFKTPGVGQRLMASALGVPVAVMESAGEGGAWGIALLAAYMARKGDGEPLESYLSKNVFAAGAGSRVEPNADDMRGFAAYMARYEKGLAIERAAAAILAP